MKQRKTLIISLSIIMFYVIIAIFAYQIAPYDPNLAVGVPFSKPSAHHLLGLNQLGQDIFSELIVGSRYSLLVSFFVSFLTITIATILGIVSGYFEGTIDHIVSRISEYILTIPFYPAAILIATLTKGTVWTVIWVLTFLSWPFVFRLVRNDVIKIKNQDYILILKVMGASSFFIIWKHILRELLPMLIYRFALRFKSTILIESTLSFLGIGSITMKSWGNILFNAQQRNAFTTGAWVWWVIPPGIVIMILSIALLMFSYSTEDILDARLKTHG